MTSPDIRAGIALLIAAMGAKGTSRIDNIAQIAASVNKTFGDALGESLGIQGTVYDKMAAKGWYQTTAAEQNKIQTVKQKFTM